MSCPYTNTNYIFKVADIALLDTTTIIKNLYQHLVYVTQSIWFLPMLNYRSVKEVTRFGNRSVILHWIVRILYY